MASTSTAPSRHSCAPGLPLTRKQLHAESIGAYYKHSAFISTNVFATVSWLAKLPKKFRDAIKEIRCYANGYEPYGKTRAEDDELEGYEKEHHVREIGRLLAIWGIIMRDGVLRKG